MSTNDDFRLPPVPPRTAQGLDEGTHASLYVAGGTHIRDVCTALGVTVYKPGLTTRRDPSDRFDDLRRVGYAKYIAPLDAPNDTFLVCQKANEIFGSPLCDNGDDPRVGEALKRIPGGAIADGTVKFLLAPNTPFVEVEATFAAVLGPRAFNTFLASADGAARLAALGLPKNARFYTDYTLMGATRRSLATELVCIRPRRELHVLVQALAVAIERVARKHRPN